MTRYALVPAKGATAEDGHKAAMIGEFHETIYFTDEDGVERTQKVPVSWDTTKAICKAFIAASPGQGAVTAEQLEAVVEALAEPEWEVVEIHPCYSRLWVVQRRGGDMTKPMVLYPAPADDVWRYGPYDYRNEAVAVCNRLLAGQIARALGLTVQP